MSARLIASATSFLVFFGCSMASPLTADAGLLDAGQVDAGPVDAGAPVATARVGATGGVLVLDGLKLDVPAGAVAADVQLEVRRTTEAPPTLPGVTALSPVYDFGPDGTVFAEGVSVSFALTSPGAGLPLIFWTQADGTFAPLPSWWTPTATHAVTMHLSRAFVGRMDTAPNAFLCCNGGTCGASGVCLVREPLASGKLLTDGQVFISNGMDVRLTAVHAPAVARGLEQRETPVRPRDEARTFTGPVFDLTMIPFMTGDVLEVCLDAKGASPDPGTCLGFFDEATSTWKCQDECLKKNTKGQLCGNTDHLTTFAILLTGGGDRTQCP